MHGQQPAFKLAQRLLRDPVLRAHDHRCLLHGLHYVAAEKQNDGHLGQNQEGRSIHFRGRYGLHHLLLSKYCLAGRRLDSEGLVH